MEAGEGLNQAGQDCILDHDLVVPDERNPGIVWGVGLVSFSLLVQLKTTECSIP